jgi:pyrroline-5-carboxylate reductase
MIKNHWQLGIIGAGVMGRALLKALIDNQAADPSRVWIGTRNKTAAESTESELSIKASENYGPLAAKTETIIICVKPKQIPIVLAKLRRSKVDKKTLIVSIAAGVSLGVLQEGLSKGQPLLRAMPNTPAIIGEGFTSIARGQFASDDHVERARKIFSTVGVIEEIDERLFDAATGLAASGPAYFFLIMEALADGGVRVGLPRDLALRMVTKTMLGSARMVEQLDCHPAALRDQVTTPAGCTIGALLVMEDGKIRSTLARAIEEAAKIAAKLGITK